MKLGVALPLIDVAVGSDPGAIREFAQTAEEIGYQDLSAPDHVLGVNVATRPDWGDRNTSADLFHDPFVLFGFLANCTRSIEFSTQVLILAQRQAVLVAKQAAEVDLLSGGRLRLGVGLGWNAVEYEALGEDFSTRGKRCDEQVELMRKLWTEPSVTFSGSYHHVTGAGLAPLPVQRPIPVWFGASSPRALRRAGRLGDGWFPMVGPGPKLEQARQQVAQAATEAGRDPAQMGMQGQVSWNGSAEDLAEGLRSWADAGASHVSINTMNAGLGSVDQHLAALTDAAEIAGELTG